MFRFQMAAIFCSITLVCYANEPQFCIDTHKSFSILGKAFNEQPWGTVDSVKKAYFDLLESGMLEYDVKRPIVYSTNISFTNFFKRICHDEICDLGDTTETLNICLRSTNEYCRLIAVTKGEDLYCLLSPFDGSFFDKPFDPFK